MPAPPPITVPPITVLLLIGALALATAGQALPPAPAPEPEPAPEVDPWASLDLALVLLDHALVQQREAERWGDVIPTVNEALTALERARDRGPPDDVCLAAQRTLRAVADHQLLLFDVDWDAGQTEDTGGLLRIADDLLYVEGRIPQTSVLVIELLFGAWEDERAAAALARGLALWPRSTMLHEQARAWNDQIPEPRSLIAQLNQRVEVLGGVDADYAGAALETIGLLEGALGRRLFEQERDYDRAAVHFARAANALADSRSMPRSMSGADIAYYRAEALGNAGAAHYARAQELWWANGRLDADARAAAFAAENDLIAALEQLPDHGPSARMILLLGELILNKAQDTAPTRADMADIRDYYGRVAERLDHPDWWNNHAFFCRETGTAAQMAGETEQARELFERSYEAYRRTIALAPDNARYVNDTGLILLYHLDRDLDQAAALFDRAWRLGRDVCENPFVEQDVYDENFSAYTDAMLNLARLRLMNGDVDGAREVNDELLMLAPERPDAQLNRMEIEGASAREG